MSVMQSWVDDLCFMQDRGSSLILSWGEDDGLWEVSWITGGKRFVARDASLILALVRCRAAGTSARVARNAITGETVAYHGALDERCRAICGQCDQDCRACILVIVDVQDEG